MRPSTAGCTERSCPYHGSDNRLKAAHSEECAIREFRGFLLGTPSGGLQGVDALNSAAEVDLDCTCGAHPIDAKACS